MALIRGAKKEGRRIVLYGAHGEGKSTWLTLAPRPYIIDCGENGLNDLVVDHGETCLSAADVFQEIEFFRHNRKTEGWHTLAFDTGDWLEALFVKAVCDQAGVKSVNEGALQFGNGNNRVRWMWSEFIAKLDELRAEAPGVTIIVTCHMTTEKVEPPNAPAYTKYVPDLSPKFSEKLAEWATEIFCLQKRVAINEEKSGMMGKRAIAVGGMERFIRTTPVAGIECKHRLTNWCPNYPAEIDFTLQSTWHDFFPGYYPASMFAAPTVPVPVSVSVPTPSVAAEPVVNV